MIYQSGGQTFDEPFCKRIPLAAQPKFSPNGSNAAGMMDAQAKKPPIEWSCPSHSGTAFPKFDKNIHMITSTCVASDQFNRMPRLTMASPKS